ncbi:hypothetical protein [Hymenobacter rubripertinctus]|nr:hypothetical protein [Hymenobacter rubripertinctus]
MRNLTGQLALQGFSLRQLAVANWPAGIYVLTARVPDGAGLRRRFSVGNP